MRWKIIVKNILQVLGLFLVIAALCVTLVSLFTTQWQISDFGQGDIHYHGLWRYCESGPNKLSTTSKDDSICYVKADASRSSRHPFLNWQMVTLALLASSCCLAFIGALFACIGWCVKLCVVGFTVATILCSLCSGSALFIFYRWSQDIDNQMERNDRNEVAQQALGISFYMSLIGWLGFFISSLFALFCTILTFMTITNTQGSKSRPRITISATK